MNRIYTIPLLAIVLLIAVACGEAPSSSPEPDRPQLICFGSIPETANPAVRAATLIEKTDQAAFRAQPFAVYGDWISDVAADTRHEVFRNQQVSYGSAGDSPSGWNYDPPQAWQPIGEYDFRAYWPASATVMGTATARTLALEYSMRTMNEDLMVAYTHCVAGNNGQAVALRFHHTLAAVAVKFRTLNAGLRCRVKNFYFTSLNQIGAFPYDATDSDADLTNRWLYADGARSTVDRTDISRSERVREWSDAAGRELTTSADDYPEEFDLFLPQSLVVDAATPPPSLTFTVEIDWNTTDTVTTTLQLPTTDSEGNEMVWCAGKRYIYVITVEADHFDIEVKTCEWDEVDALVGDIRF